MWPEGLIANFVSDVETHPVHPVCSSSLLDRIYRIEEYLSHARLTLHAASALKPQSRQGRGIEDFLSTSAQRARGVETSICG